MAVNLIDSTDIEITQTGDNIQLNTTVDMQTLESNVSTNTSDIEDLQNGNVYSTTEVKTNKIWIDGKPIYRKVVNVGAMPNNTVKEVEHGIMDIDHITAIEGIANDSTTQMPMPLQYRGIDSTYNIEIGVTSTKIRLSSNTDRSRYSAYITLEYTKTTD